MRTNISPQTRAELVQALRQRYQKASRVEKTRILDEDVAPADCHRRHATRLLAGASPVGPAALAAPAHDRRTYTEAVREALTLLGEAADRICGKRL